MNITKKVLLIPLLYSFFITCNDRLLLGTASLVFGHTASNILNNHYDRTEKKYTIHSGAVIALHIMQWVGYIGGTGWIFTFHARQNPLFTVYPATALASEILRSSVSTGDNSNFRLGLPFKNYLKSISVPLISSIYVLTQYTSEEIDAIHVLQHSPNFKIISR